MSGSAGLVPPVEVVEAVRRGKRFLVTAHPGPDGDAIGSMAATLLALEALGREVLAFNPDPVPQRFAFLAGTERFVDALADAVVFDTTLVLDCSDERMFEEAGRLGPDRLGTVVVIDHHKTAGAFGDLVWRDQTAASVGVMLFLLFEALEVPPSVEIAAALYCSLISDTGSFRYQNTNAAAMRTAATLLERGVDPWRVSSAIYEDRPCCEVQLLALVLQTLALSSDGRAACLTVNQQMLDSTGATPDMIDGFINYARGIRGVEVAILLRPGPRGVRVSMRSHGRVDVSRLAERFGGGGHHNAAGCSVPGDDVGQVQADLFAEVGRLLA